ncbi:hypothetical protein QYM36_010603, partial [Artemia franciscana]
DSHLYTKQEKDDSLNGDFETVRDDNENINLEFTSTYILRRTIAKRLFPTPPSSFFCPFRVKHPGGPFSSPSSFRRMKVDGASSEN